MYTISYNIIFVYCLLITDLLINITDHLLTTTTVVASTKSVQLDSRHEREISGIAFIVVIIQIFAIFCIVINLVLHLFQISDQVRQFAWLQLCQNTRSSANHSLIERKPQRLIETPMPQRIALKLVLEKYWWSLLVGLLYLVLTIILQIIRLDPIWHHDRENLNSGKLLSLLNSDMSIVGGDLPVSNNLRMASDELSLKLDIVGSGDEFMIGDGEEHNTGSYNDNKTLYSLNKNLLPVIILLIHKLMSTCYYVSFVVVYRATPTQKLHRIFINKQNPQSLSSYNQQQDQTTFVHNYQSNK